MAMVSGVAALPDAALLSHPVLGDARRRETQEGVDAFLRMHLSEEALVSLLMPTRVLIVGPR